MENNGEIVRVLPTIKVTWDESRQAVSWQWDDKEIRNAAFALQMLKMAVEAIDDKLKVQKAMIAQQEIMEAARANALASKLAGRG